jgi:hypothetical protein
VGDIDNGFLIQLSDGKILCGFRNHSVDASQKNRPFTHYRIMICVSEDCGKEWSYLSTPDEVYPLLPTFYTRFLTTFQSADHSKGLWEPFFRLAKDGTLQLFYSRENRPSDQDSIVRTSHDGGATWGDAIVFGSKATDARDGMLGVAKFGEELVAVFETNECDNGMHIKCVMSSGMLLLLSFIYSYSPLSSTLTHHAFR